MCLVKACVTSYVKLTVPSFISYPQYSGLYELLLQHSAHNTLTYSLLCLSSPEPEHKLLAVVDNELFEDR